MSRRSMQGLVRGAGALALAASFGALAGGPLSVCTGNTPVKYSGAGTVTLNYDQGNLGARTKAQADTLVTNAVSAWTNLGTATVTLARGTDLPVDVTTANLATYLNNFTDLKNPVIYDTDGSITDAIFGTGASGQVLGFAGSQSSGCQYTEGQAVLNGAIAVSDTTMSIVITHEVGHLIGLDHTQIDGAQGLATSNFPLMYPIAYRASATLHEDDAAAVSALYPDTTFATSYGTLTGTLTQSNGAAVRGANIWAQGAGGTFSIVSDYLGQGTGHFDLHLPPGTYTLHAEAIDPSFIGGSSVGPYSDTLSDPSFQPPMYTGANAGGSPMAPVTLGGGTPTQITITGGCSGSVAFKLDGTGTLTGNCNVPPPAAPTTIAPSGTITTATPAYSWNASSGAASYLLQVQNTSGVAVSQSLSATAAGCAAGTGTCTFTPTTALTNGASYNWFVSASNAGGTSAWSAGRAITVNTGAPVTIPPAPTTVSPSGTLTTTTPTYTWNASAGATSYGLLVQGPTGFFINTSFTATAVGCGAGTGTCSVKPTTALVNGTAYTWMVSATNSAGTSALSASKSITVNAPTASPPAAPTLVSPSGAVTTTTPAYTWNASAGATSYYLLVQNTAGVAIGVSFSATAVGCGAGTGTCSVTPATALANGSAYNWFVNATNSVGTSAWSAGNAITVSSATAPSPPTVPVTVSPSGVVTTATPTYTWNASAGATSYYLLAQNTAGVAVSQSFTATAAGCGAGTGTCSVTPTTALSNGASYNWFVNATNSIGTSAWSAARGISVSAAGPSVPFAPVTSTPSGTVTTTTPTYTWNASTGATSYYVLAQNTAGVAVSQSVTATAAGCGAGAGTCSLTPTSALSNGASYNWFVNASNSLGTSPWSAARAISVSATGPSVPLAPTLISPNGATGGTTTPTYTWNASAGATSYYLLVQNTAGVAVSVSVSATAAGCGAGTGTCAFMPTTALTIGAIYNWFVNASNSLGTSPWSAGMPVHAP